MLGKMSAAFQLEVDVNGRATDGDDSIWIETNLNL